MTLKQERMDQILLREISRILQFEMKDSNLGFVTVTDVEVNRDMSQAKVYVSFLGKQEGGNHDMEVLKKSKGFIKTLLAKNIRARKIPDLIFIRDNSLDRYNRIENILNSLDETSRDDETSDS